ELGCGISTLYVAALLRQRGGQLISFEHDERWAAIITSQLEHNHLSSAAVVVHAPLTDNSHALDNCQWYKVDAIQSALRGKRIDGLIVDGPPASGKSRAFSRFPAVPVLNEFFSDSYFVYLDDINRHAEAEILKRWAAQLSLISETETV